ncbi:MAG: endonuclease/exonuclease/phosphatase family protein [Microthrixaceae bacterium]|nr:endonuclease/exonuclease/phosphatase family protein [Microthrixaceae bacterium]MCO5311466.1 endonuclease/exonuclease/phosphatase family protein [Microthrixaceae bacterium]
MNDAMEIPGRATVTLRMRLRALGAGVAIWVVAVAVSLLIPMREASAHANRNHYFQYNMYGRLGNGGGLAPANRVINHKGFMEQNGHLPIGISLQEVCRNPNDENSSQFGRVKSFLPQYQWEFFWLADTTTQNCQQYGIAVGSYGSATGGRLSLLLSPDAGEDRGVLCERSDLFGTIAACSTHLTNNDNADAAAQLNDALGKADDWFNNTSAAWRYFGGDFNIEPGEMSPPNVAYNNRIAADPDKLDTWKVTPNPNLTRKIDYGVVSSVWASGSSGTRWLTSESDHVLLEGHFIPK